MMAIKPRVNAAGIKQRIEQALEPQAEVDAHRVSITMGGGKVKLDDKVRAWFERDAIERAASAAPGVTGVEDRVTVGLRRPCPASAPQ